MAISLSTPPDQCEISLRKSPAHRPDSPTAIHSNPRQNRGNRSKATAGKNLHNASQAASISLIAGPMEGSMTLQISRRGKEYLKTAQTLLHSAHTATDRVVADQLKALADSYERRAEQASHADAAKALARATAAAENEALFEGDRT